MRVDKETSEQEARMARDRKKAPELDPRKITIMISLLSAATSTPQHAFQTTELTNALMHQLSPELITTLNSLGVEQRYSVMDNYPDFLSGKKMNANSCNHGPRREGNSAVHRALAG